MLFRSCESWPQGLVHLHGKKQSWSCILSGRAHSKWCVSKREERKKGVIMVTYNDGMFMFFPEPPRLVPVTSGQDLFDEGTSAQILCSVSAGDEPL